MLISDTLEVASRQELRILKFPLVLELAGSQETESEVKQPTSSTKKPKEQLQTKIGKPASSQYISMLSSNLPPINNVGKEKYGEVHREEPVQLPIPEKSNHTKQEEVSGDDDIWKYYADILDDDSQWEKASKEKTSSSNNISSSKDNSNSVHTSGKNYSKNSKESASTPQLSSHESELTENLTYESKKKTLGGNQNPFKFSQANPKLPYSQKNSQSDLNKLQTQDNSVINANKSSRGFDEELINKQNLLRNRATDSPSRQTLKRRERKMLIEEEDNTSEKRTEEYEKIEKKLKRNDDDFQQDQSSLRTRDTNKNERRSGSSKKKKVAIPNRRKPLQLDDYDSDSHENSQKENKQASNQALNNSRPQDMDLESPSQSQEEKKVVEASEEESKEASHARDGKDRRSSLSHNQLKRLKKIVTDKREAAAKQSVGKTAPAQSQESNPSCVICLCKIIFLCLS